MSYSATVNLGTVGSDITGQTVSISGCTGASCGSGCTSLVTSQAVSGFPKVITGIPDNVVSLFVKVDGGSCAGTTQCITVTGGGVATPTPTITSTITPTFTITPTSTPGDPTPTPTVTPTITPNFQYWYELTRCDDGTTTCYSVPIEGGAANVGKVFWSSGGNYYTMGSYWNTNNPADDPGVGSCSNKLDGTIVIGTCSDYVVVPPPPAPTPGISMLVHTGSTFGGSAAPCAMYESDIATNSTTLYLSGHTIPANGDYAYDSNLCVTTFVGDGTYYAVLANSTKYAMTIGPTGYINNVVQCNAITPTPTPPIPTPTPTITPIDMGGGGGIPTDGTYDCLSGLCVEAVVGTYSSLMDCQASGCESAPPPCFVEGTLITMNDGTQKLIEELVVGEILKSYNIDTLPLYSDDETVLNTWSSQNITGSPDVATITSIVSDISHGIFIINDSLKTTGRHRHLIKRNNTWSFIEAYQVVVGDIMLDINNNEVEVISKTTDKSDYTIYKLDVENLDVFYANNILTHNVKG